MLTYRNFAAVIFATVASFGCRPDIPVPVGYEANVEVRDWASRMLATDERSNLNVVVGGYDPEYLGLKEFKLNLRGRARISFAKLLQTSCKKSGTLGPQKSQPNGHGAWFTVWPKGRSFTRIYLSFSQLAQDHGPVVANHKAEIRQLLRDAYREKEARKAAERKRYPWKKD
jgi:hypothetical protein